MGEIIKVAYRDKDTKIELSKVYSFNFQLERYNEQPFCFYLLENGERIKRTTPQRSYGIGDFVIFPRSTYGIDIFHVICFLPDDNMVIQIEPYQPQEKIPKIGF